MSQQKAKRPNDGYFLWVSREFVFLLDLWITKCSLGCTDSRILRGKLQGFNKAGLVQFPIGEIWKEPCNRPPKKSDLLTCLLMHLNAKRMWTVEIESYLFVGGPLQGQQKRHYVTHFTFVTHLRGTKFHLNWMDKVPWEYLLDLEQHLSQNLFARVCNVCLQCLEWICKGHRRCADLFLAPAGFL